MIYYSYEISVIAHISGIAMRFFMVLTWAKWRDMSVFRTMSITAARNSLQSAIYFLNFNVVYRSQVCN